MRERGRSGSGHGPEPASRRSGDRHVLVIVAGVVAFLTDLWLGMVVIGDGAGRSAVLAGLIATLVAVGTATTGRHRSEPPRR